MGQIESSCAYWVLLEDWRGETVYIEARGVDYIARLPGCENPVRWYDQFPQLAAALDEQEEERSHIDLMIALDNWRWMPVCQACLLVGRQDQDEMEDTRLLAQTQFRKRLVMLNATDANELIPPEMADEDYEEPRPRGGPLATQKIENRVENRRKAEVWGSTP
jgi:hypothetical protein